MSRRPALTNRIGLTIIGLLLFAIGGAALIRGLDLYRPIFGRGHTAVVDRSARTFADHNTWFWVALAVALFVIAVVCVSWLVAQSQGGTARAMRFDDGTREGVTTLSARALTDALCDDLDGNPYLRRCSAKFVGSPEAPRLRLAVTVDPDADPAAARDGIRQALRRLHRAVETEHLPTVVYIRPDH